MNIKLKLQHKLLKGQIGFLRKKHNLQEKIKKYKTLYAFLGGTGVILFWHGIWEGLNLIYINSKGLIKYIGHPLFSLVLGSLILAVSGLYVFELIGRDARVFEQKYDYKLDKLSKLEKLLAEEENEEDAKDELADMNEDGAELEEES